MHSNITLTKRMLNYAGRHNIKTPRVSIVNPYWGKGKRTLAWRVSGSLHMRGKDVPQSARHTQKLDDFFFPETKMHRTVRLAIAELGVMETPAGSNDGPRVNTYQKITGAMNQPWCASFVTWCYKQAGVSLPSFNRAYVPSWSYSAKHGLGKMHTVSKLKLRRGDAVCLWHDGHIELFEKWIIRGVSFHCIGGNTSVAGKANNGGMVCRTTRYPYEVSCAIRVV